MKIQFIRNVYLAIAVLLLPGISQALSFKTEHWQTTNGAQVVFYQAMEVPMLDISVAFAAGSAYDGNAFGLSTLTASLLAQGNHGLDATAIADKLANVGAQYRNDTNQDMAVFNLKTLNTADALQQAINTFHDIINYPDFPADAFARAKNQQLVSIAQSLESPDDVANQTFYRMLYKNHPYAHPINGDQNTVHNIKIEQVRNFYHRYFVASNAIVVIVGAIDIAGAKRLSEQLVKDLPKGQPAETIAKMPALTEALAVEVKFPTKQTMLRLGQVGIDHHASDYFPLMVGNYILGGGTLVSRLAYEVREKRGLTYGVYSEFIPLPGNGPFIISLSTKNAQAKTALDITQKTLVTFVQSGPDEQELIAAKKYLVGSFPLSLASNSNIASMLLKIAFYHLPNDYLDTYVARIEAVNKDDIKRAFQQHIDPNKLLQISVGKL